MISPARCFLLVLLAFLVFAGTALAQQTVSCDTHTPQDPPTDKDVLITLYCETNGDNWRQKNKWLTDDLIGDWINVDTDTSGRVTELRLYNQNLSGSIPSELGDLTSLVNLHLDDNQLSGSIPSELGSLTSLVKLHLHRNQLTGSIPAELGSLSSLEQLWLNHNQLSSSIPAELGNLGNLEQLYLYDNQLTGDIPTELVNLGSLKELVLFQNQLSGGIPTGLDNLGNLEKLLLRENQLSGGIPVELGNLTNLEQLNLSDNNLTGSIPAELGNLSSLKELNLSGNNLTDSIPVELGNLSSLNRLYLNRNQLSGSIPVELGMLSTNLWVLFLDENQLSGGIPTELGMLSVLEFLYLNGNQLSGSIPVELGMLSALKRLYLNENQLTGSIPAELFDLSDLQLLHLNRNQLSGDIPAGLDDLSKLQQLDFSYNRSLTGTLPVNLRNVSSLRSLDIRCTDISVPEDENFQTWLNGITFRGTCPPPPPPPPVFLPPPPPPPPPVIESAQGVLHSGDAEDGFSLTPVGEGGNIVYGERTINISVARDECPSSDSNPAVIVSRDVLDGVTEITFELFEVSPQDPPSGFRLDGCAAEIDLAGVELAEGETVTVCLPLAEGEEESYIYHYDEVSGEWERLETVKKTVNEMPMVCAETDTFSLFGVFVEEEEIAPPSPSTGGSGCAIATANGQAGTAGWLEKAVFNLFLTMSVLLLITGRNLSRRLNGFRTCSTRESRRVSGLGAPWRWSI